MTTWKPIPGTEHYLVSDQGEIKRIESGRILKQTLMHNGYKVIGMHENGKKHMRYVHRVVGEAFGIRKPGFQLDHINGNKADNRACNLRAVTCSENLRNPLTYPTYCKKVIGVGPQGETIEFNSLKEAAKAVGVKPTNICACLKGKTKTSGGYVWSYKN